MNIFDFDGTLYEGDSSVDFYKFNLKKKPSLCLLWPMQLGAFLLYKLKLIDRTREKELWYRYFRKIDAASLVDEFWSTHLEKIYPWYYDLHKEDDVIVSAGPAWLVGKAAEHLGVRTLIASRVDPATGIYDGADCSGEEKLRRFTEVFPDAEVECAYFDQKSDLPVSRLAGHLMLVHHYGYVRELDPEEVE